MKISKTKKLFNYLIIICCFPLIAKSNATITINTTEVNEQKITNLLNGVFSEPILDVINGKCGLWAQEIMDRGFESVEHFAWNYYFSEGNKETNKDKILISNGGYNKSDSYQLFIQNTENIELGLFQRIYLNDTISHNFYIYAKSENAVGTARLILFDTLNNKIHFEKEIEISNDDWNKIEFEIPPISNIYTFNLAITYKGSGKVYFDEASLVPTNNVLGMRKEWVDIFKELKPGIWRYPSGGFTEMLSYNWKDAIDHIDQRKTYIIDSENYRLQKFDFGIEEYIQLCKEFDMAPLITLPISFYSSGPKPNYLEDACNFIEYLNGDTTTKWGKERAKNGHPAPYNVKHIDIGNEPWLMTTVEEYIEQCNKIYDTIQPIYPDIIFNVCDNIWTSHLDSLILYLGDNINSIAYHPAVHTSTKLDNSLKSFLQLCSDGKMITKTIEKIRKKIKDNGYNFMICLNEWWTIFDIYYPNDDGPIQWHALNPTNISITSAICNGLYLNNIYKYSDIIKFACRTLALRHVILETDDNGRKNICMSPGLKAQTMLSKHIDNYYVNTKLTCDSFQLNEWPPYWSDKTPYLDATTTISNDSIFISVINIHPTDSITTKVLLLGAKVNNTAKIYSLTADSFFSIDTTYSYQKDIIYAENEYKINDKNTDSISTIFDYKFPKHSITIIAIPYKKYDSIINNNNNKEVVIFPNPNQNIINIKLPDGIKVKNISIINNLGSKVYESVINNNSTLAIKNTNLPKGAYQVILECLDGKIINTNIVIDK